MISDAALLEAVEQGVTVAQLVAMILADRNAARAKRAARKAARLAEGGAQGEHVESGLRVASRTQRDPVAVPPLTSSPASAEGLEHPRVRLAVARKAIAWLDVPGNAKAVMGALLDFCGEAPRCGVGLDFIARRLGRGGADPRRNIRRGISDLVAAGLLKVAAHAGMRHVNVYFPQWDRLAAVVAAFESGRGVRVQSDRGDKIVLQSQKKIPTSVAVRRVQQATEPDRRQRELMLPVVIAGGRGGGAAVPAAIAREQAGLRLGTAYRERLHQLGEAAGRELKGSVTAADWEAGVVAEMARRGSGLQAMLDAGFARWSAETKPPSAATG